MILSSAFTEDRGSEYRGQVRALQERIREFESGSHETHVTTNPPTVHTLHSERGVVWSRGRNFVRFFFN